MVILPICRFLSYFNFLKVYYRLVIEFEFLHVQMRWKVQSTHFEQWAKWCQLIIVTHISELQRSQFLTTATTTTTNYQEDKTCYQRLAFVSFLQHVFCVSESIILRKKIMSWQPPNLRLPPRILKFCMDIISCVKNTLQCNLQLALLCAKMK